MKSARTLSLRSNLGISRIQAVISMEVAGLHRLNLELRRYSWRVFETHSLLV
jgi:hypothetical protein